jgi:CO/xanthine dehydrogenase Mo-binding subunit
MTRERESVAAPFGSSVEADDRQPSSESLAARLAARAEGAERERGDSGARRLAARRPLHRHPDADAAVGAAVSRRGFLTAAGALVFAFTWPSSSPHSEAQASQGAVGAGAAAGRGALPLDRVDSFLAIDADGIVTLFTGKVELGTGVQTALAQIVAEELDAPMARLRVVQGDTSLTPNQGGTTGSKTIQMGAVPIRRAAAAARQALLELASTRLSAPVADLAITDGVVHAQRDRSKSVSFGDLVGGRRFERPVKEMGGAATKPSSSYHIVGQSAPRMDLPTKVLGTHEYVHNLRLPGMRHGRVVRPSAIGATLVSIDESSIKAIPGIVKIVRRANFVGIVAEREEQAVAAAQALKVVWTPPSAGLPAIEKLEATIRATAADVRVLNAAGDVATALAAAEKTRMRHEATYSTPFQSHASIGPSCAVADVRDGEATVWCGTQTAGDLRRALAELLTLPVERVRVAWTEASGCYGHNGADDAASDAALLSREAGQPVRVQWMRQDEHAWDPKGPAMLMDVKAGLDASGKIAAWDYVVTTPTHIGRPVGRAGNLLAAQLMGATPSFLMGGGDRNAEHRYVVPNNRATARVMKDSVLRPSAFRGLGAPANAFAIESFMDELALAARVDPVQFRLRHLEDPRAIAVITRVAELASWQPRRAAATSAPASVSASASASAPAHATPASRSAPGRRTAASHVAGAAAPAASSDIAIGRGISFLQYENANAYVATIADVEVNRRTGAVRVTRVFVAHDCGLIVNPDGLRNQIEGGTIQTISRTLKEEVRWDREKVTTVDWQSYPILTFSEVPDTIEIALIDHPELPPLGAGEPAVCAVPAAIGNAIAAATGIRLRALPFTPARVKAALA